MLRSSVITSGRSCSTSSKASSPSRAAPTTSRNGLRESICRTTLRTKAESSTISTRTTPAMPPPSLLHVHKRPADLLQLERRAHPQKRLGNPDEQITRPGHPRRKAGGDLRDGGRREVDEHVTAKNVPRRVQARSFVGIEQVGAAVADASVQLGVSPPTAFDGSEILRPQGSGQGAEGPFPVHTTGGLFQRRRADVTGP